MAPLKRAKVDRSKKQPAGEKTRSKASKTAASTSSPSESRPPMPNKSKPRRSLRHRSLFLELPAEIRNHIYTRVAEEDTGHLIDVEAQYPYFVTSPDPWILISLAPLARVNRQIRREYLAKLVPSMQHFHAVIEDFHFDHVIVFLLSLRDDQLQRLPGADKKDKFNTGTRSFQFSLKLTELPSYEEIHPVSYLSWIEIFCDDKGPDDRMNFGFIFPTYVLHPSPPATSQMKQTVVRWLDLAKRLRPMPIRMLMESRRMEARLEMWQEMWQEMVYRQERESRRLPGN